MDGPFAKDLSDFARNCPRVEVWQKDASETPRLYRVIRSVVRKYVSGYEQALSQPKSFSGLPPDRGPRL